MLYCHKLFLNLRLKTTFFPATSPREVFAIFPLAPKYIFLFIWIQTFHMKKYWVNSEIYPRLLVLLLFRPHKESLSACTYIYMALSKDLSITVRVIPHHHHFFLRFSLRHFSLWNTSNRLDRPALQMWLWVCLQIHLHYIPIWKGFPLGSLSKWVDWLTGNYSCRKTKRQWPRDLAKWRTLLQLGCASDAIIIA